MKFNIFNGDVLLTTTTSTGLMWLAIARWYDQDSKNTKRGFTSAAQRNAAYVWMNDTIYVGLLVESRQRQLLKKLVEAQSSAAQSAAAAANSCNWVAPAWKKRSS